MVTVESGEGVVRAVDATKRSVELEGDLRPASAGPDLGRSVDAIRRVRARTLTVANAFVVVERLDDGTRMEFGQRADPVRFDGAAHRVRVATPVTTYLRFDGTATMRMPDADTIAFEFGAETPVTLGFRSRLKRPADHLTAPPTPEGVADALTAFAGWHRTTTADRSFPSMRLHPPTVAFEEDASVPAAAETPAPVGDVTVRVPRDLRALLSVAPLAYYLGARVELDDHAPPALLAGEEWPLGDGSLGEEQPLGDGLETAAATVLRRVFYLDCLVRTAGPHGSVLTETPALGATGIDPEQLYDAPISDRVDRYLAADYGPVREVVPEWHLSLYVPASVEAVASLPHVLYNVPQVFEPRARPLDDDEWLSRSLDDFYRARSSVSVDLTLPELRSGRTHGWFGEEAPIDVFKALPEGYENRNRHWNHAPDAISIVAVVNESEMEHEGDEAARVYRDRAADLDLDVTVRTDLTVDELATVFETPTDFVHYVGHCEPEGLVCADGYLSAADLAESNAQTFFLNACGSYYEGIDLVRKGSVAGGVTFNRVLDGNAALVGTAFARLLVQGFSVERAMSLARRRVIAGKDYAVVGDGTHTLTGMSGVISGHLEVTDADDGYHVVHDVYTPRFHGGVYQSDLQTDEESRLYGNSQEFVVDEDRLCWYLESAGEQPVVYEGDLHWAEELAETLCA